MNEQSNNIHSAAIQNSLNLWHSMIAARDMSGLHEIIHPDAVFRSPIAHTPYEGREALVVVLTAANEIFDGFTYHREFATDDGGSVALEFSARVSGKDLKGADFIRFDEDGLITAFEVMIRPASGLMALGEEMGKRVGARLKDFS